MFWLTTEKANGSESYGGLLVEKTNSIPYTMTNWLGLAAIVLNKIWPLSEKNKVYIEKYFKIFALSFI